MSTQLFNGFTIISQTSEAIQTVSHFSVRVLEESSSMHMPLLILMIPSLKASFNFSSASLLPTDLIGLIEQSGKWVLMKSDSTRWRLIFSAFIDTFYLEDLSNFDPTVLLSRINYTTWNAVAAALGCGDGMLVLVVLCYLWLAHCSTYGCSVVLHVKYRC